MRGVSVLQALVLILLAKMLIPGLGAVLGPFQSHLKTARMMHFALLTVPQDSQLPLTAMLTLVAPLLLSHTLAAMKPILHALEWELLQLLSLPPHSVVLLVFLWPILVAQRLDSRMKLT